MAPQELLGMLRDEAQLKMQEEKKQAHDTAQTHESSEIKTVDLGMLGKASNLPTTRGRTVEIIKAAAKKEPKKKSGGD
jgi:hypothetical protein